MCKLLAYANFNPTLPATVGLKVNKALHHLFYINSFGQTDGSGIMCMNHKGDYEYLKEAVSSTIFTQLSSFSSLKLELYKEAFVAAHTRYSTVGSNSWENTHPFEFGRYLGMQNGTIAHSCSHTTLVPGKTSPCAVDSASVIWSLDEQGIEATFDRYEGEGVFIFFDLVNSTLNIVKNKHRNLHVTKIKDHDAYIFGTDKYAIMLACDRSSLEIEEPIPVPNDMLLTYSTTGKITETPLVVKEATYSYSGGYYKGYGSWYGNAANRTVNLPAIPPKDNKVVSFPGDWDNDDYLGTYTPPKHSKGGEYITDCDFCASPIHSKDIFFADDPSFDHPKVVSCSCCVKEVQEITGTTLHLVRYKPEGTS